MATIDETRRLFGEHGYVVMPAAVSDALIEAANERADDILRDEPPPKDKTGLHTYALQLLGADPLLATVIESFAFPVAESMVAPKDLFYPTRCQLALSLPGDSQQPDAPRLDGIDTPEPDGRPATYSLLMGVFLTDCKEPDTGAPIVWPGTHLKAASYFAQHGADSITRAPYPPVELPAPEPVIARAGDLFIAHYLLGRAHGPNRTRETARIVYFRSSVDKHRRTWQQAVSDAFFEFEAVRKVVSP